MMALLRTPLLFWFAHPWLSRMAALALSMALCWLLLALAPGAFTRLQEHSTDVVWRGAASTVPERRVVMVDIDDASLQQVGAWPWSRTTLASLERQLDSAGVGLKLYDIVFPDAREGDADLASALKSNDLNAPSVLAQIFALRNESHLRSGQLVGALPGIGCQAPAVSAQGFVANAPGLHGRAGHITPTIDPDGTVRTMAALVCMDEQVFPMLALAGIASLDGASQPLQIRKGQGWSDPAWRMELASLPGHAIGVDSQGQVRVPFTVSRDALTRVSAADVLNGKLPEGLLQGAWVVIGSSAFGLADVVPVALGGAVSGAEVHMQLLLGMLDGKVPHVPLAQSGMQVAFAVPVVLALLWLAGGAPLQWRQQVLLIPVVSLGAAGLAYGLHVAALVEADWLVGWVVPAGFILVFGMLLTVGEQARLIIEKKRIYENLASYVSNPVAQRIALNELSGDIEARRCDVTVLSADLKNFARYSEACSPEDTARVLHRFFTTASAIVEAHGGMVEEMVGDSLVAVFNGEQPCEDHPVAALSAARELWQRCSSEMPNVSHLGLEALSIGVGVESGMAMVGSFGPAQRRVHTVLGQTVTVALRLRDMTSDLAYPLLLGQDLAQRLGALDQAEHMQLKTLGSFMLPGLVSPSTIYTLRHLLQPGDASEQRTLLYLRQQQNFAA